MKYVKSISIFVMGLAVGVGGSFKYFKTKYQAIANEEIDSVKMMVKNRTMKAEGIVGGMSKLNDTLNVEPGAVIEYNKLARRYTTESSLLKSTLKSTVQEAAKAHDEKVPYLISSKEFIEECLNYEKITLTYYESEEVLLDEREEIIDNANNLVGNDFSNHFDENETEKDVVYIRNDYDDTDYEIVRSHLSYSQDIMGQK